MAEEICGSFFHVIFCFNSGKSCFDWESYVEDCVV